LLPLRRDGVAHRGAEVHDLGGCLGAVLALAHELLDLRPGELHLEPDGRGAAGGERAAAGKRGGGRGGGGEAEGPGEVGGGAAREHQRLEPLPRADAEVARPGAAHARQRDEEVEPAPAERRVGRERARAGAEQLHLLRLQQLEARVVPQHVGGGRGRLDAEGGAVQLHHLGALALAPEAVPHPLSTSLLLRGVCGLSSSLRLCGRGGAGYVCLSSSLRGEGVLKAEHGKGQPRRRRRETTFPIGTNVFLHSMTQTVCHRLHLQSVFKRQRQIVVAILPYHASCPVTSIPFLRESESIQLRNCWSWSGS
jgi:hypothetical protein